MRLRFLAVLAACGPLIGLAAAVPPDPRTADAPPSAKVPSFQVPAIEKAADPLSFAAKPHATNTRTVYLGRAGKKAGRPTLHLSDFRVTASTPAPVSIDWSAKAMKSIRLVYGNDQQGDCVIASGEHQIGVMTGNDSDSGGIVTGTTAEALSEYHRIGGPGDNGLYIPDALDDFATTGLLCGGKRHKIEAWGGFDSTNQELTKVAIVVFGTCRIGFNVPAEWMNNVVDGAVWDTPRSFSFVGGHDVPLVGYNATGVQVATWGLVTTITWRAFMNSRIVDEAYFQLGPQWFGQDNLAPNGISVIPLRKAVADMKAGTIPSWQPDGPPPAPPVVQLIATPTAGPAPLTVAFRYTSTGGGLTTATLAFGDGTTSADPTVSHTYTTAGSYTATLTATGPGGVSQSSVTVSVGVVPPPPPPPGILTIVTPRGDRIPLPAGTTVEGALEQEMAGIDPAMAAAIRTIIAAAKKK